MSIALAALGLGLFLILARPAADPVCLSRRYTGTPISAGWLDPVAPYLTWQEIPGLVRHDYTGISVATVPLGYIYRAADKIIWSAESSS